MGLKTTSGVCNEYELRFHTPASCLRQGRRIAPRVPPGLALQGGPPSHEEAPGDTQMGPSIPASRKGERIPHILARDRTGITYLEYAASGSGFPLGKQHPKP